MKKLLFILAFISVSLAYADDITSPKFEARSSWFQTVWNGDFPSDVGANATYASKQKAQIDRYVDYFDQANMNMMCYQVRSMSDAFYPSRFPEEAWSKFLTGQRGLAPEYDPLAYAIEACHKRGIEFHAWINPYRYSTSSSTHGTLPTDYANTHPDWLINCDGTYILNPGLPEVRQRIVDVVMDIVENYDVDGIIFDDYFYQSGMKDEYDDSLYLHFNPDSLSRADWRREQVNLMVKGVHDAIMAKKPWVRFGIGPAGVACSSKAVADKYGISPCPNGSDWQYNGIYSDPMAWISRHYIDYISPQVYWPIGGSGNDYAKITPWWYYACQHFDCQCYISTSLSGWENRGWKEYINEIRLNRSSSKDGVSGIVFFNTKPWVNNFVKHFQDEVFQNRCLPPAMTSRKVSAQGMVNNMTYNGQTLTWQYDDTLARYAVYCIPKEERHDHEALTSAKYLMGMSYNKYMNLPPTVSESTHAIAVTVVDRYGFEYAPRFYGENLNALAVPQLTFPADKDSILLPNILQWEEMTDAMSYMVEISDDPSMSAPLITVPVDTCGLLTQKYAVLDGSKTYYWRVRAAAANTPSEWSEVRSFQGKMFNITSPYDGENNVAEAPLIEWDDAGNSATYKLEIAENLSFYPDQLTFSQTTTSTSVQLPKNILKYEHAYYARVTMTNSFTTVTSSPVYFTTQTIVFEVPQIITPSEGETVTAPGITVVVEELPSNGIRYELSSTPTFPPRSIKRAQPGTGVFSYTFTDVPSGVYYVRACNIKADGTYTDYSDVICFTYEVGTGVNDVHVISPVHKVWNASGFYIFKDNVWYDIMGNRYKK